NPGSGSEGDMLKSVTESSRRHSQALSYIPGEGVLLAGATTEYRLGHLIAEGGEGRVYAIQQRDDVVAKVYKELDLSHRGKLAAMVSRGSRSLRRVCAWPLTALSDGNDETVGFVME